MQLKPSLLTVVVFVVLLNTALAKGVQQEIKFKPGESSTAIESTVLRGDRDKYTLTAKAGQIVSVSIAAEEDNAVFQIYRKTSHGWEPLEGASENDDATDWEDKLLGKGIEHLKIIVSGKRGNATYTLAVAIE